MNNIFEKINNLNNQIIINLIVEIKLINFIPLKTQIK